MTAKPCTITLPDGSQRRSDRSVTVAEVAAAIGPGLAKDTVAGKVDGRLVDACDPSDQGATFRRTRPARCSGTRAAGSCSRN